MDTREELAAGLQQALYLMREMIELQGKRANIRSQYPIQIGPYEPLSGKRRTKRIVLISMGIALFLSQTLVWNYIGQVFWLIFFNNMNIAKILAWVVVTGIGVLCARAIMKISDKSTANKNVKISQRNAIVIENSKPLVQAEAGVIQQMRRVQEQYAKEILPWYPSNYCYIDAAEFLLNAVKNFKADNIKEAINLYDDALHKRRMEHAQQQMLDNQDEMVRQQKLNNALAIGSMVMQAGIQNSIDNNTSAVNNVSNTLNRKFYDRR